MSELVILAKTVGTVAAGLSAGCMLSTNTYVMPSIWAVPSLKPDDRVLFFNRYFLRGLSIITPLAVVAGGSLALAAYLQSASVLTTRNGGLLGYIANNRRAVLGTAAALIFSAAPYTRLVMMPGISALAKYEADGARAARIDTDALIRAWQGQHTLRVVTSTIAFILTILESLV